MFPDRALLDRFLTGECTAEEAEHVRQWLAADPRNLAQLNQLREIREVMSSRATWDVAGLWRRTAAEIARVEPEGGFARKDEPVGRIAPTGAGAPPDRRRRAPRFAWAGAAPRSYAWRIAAAITLVAGAALFWQEIRPDQPMIADSTVTTLHEYATGRGKVARLELPDGTAVLLSVASRLRVPTDFSRSRTVYLEGEARFTVPPRDGQPFFVQAGGLITRDLSTEFGVRAYPGEDGARVVVSEGSVSVRETVGPRAPATVLDAGDVLTRSAGRGIAVARGVDLSPYLGWTRRELVFRRVPVRAVLEELARWHDLEFEIADSSLATRKMSATLAADRLTPEVLSLLAASADMRVEYRGSTVVFSRARLRR